MKTRLFILVILMAITSAISTSLNAAETIEPVITTELPSSSYLTKEKRSIATTQSSSALSSPVLGLAKPFAAGWNDPFLPGEGDGETSFPGTVGAPIGDVTLPVAFLALLIYFLYRGVTATSKRKSNF